MRRHPVLADAAALTPLDFSIYYYRLAECRFSPTKEGEEPVPKNKGFYIIAFMVLIWGLGPLAARSAAGASLGPVKAICVYYHDKFHGQRLSSGEKYNKGALTAAHATLPFGTMVKVTNPSNNRSVVVRVNDRRPNRRSTATIIEITSRAATEIDIIQAGRAQVLIEIIESGKN
jgi:rare lipoprotein A